MVVFPLKFSFSRRLRLCYLLDCILRFEAPSASTRVAALRSLDLGPPTLDEEAKSHL